MTTEVGHYFRMRQPFSSSEMQVERWHGGARQVRAMPGFLDE